MRTILASLLLATPLFAAEPKVHRDLPYAEPKNERQTLDVYAPAEGKDHPLVVWIHGGGWRRGDKASVQKKPQAFVDKGFVFVSTNYRFVPNVTVKEMTGDIAKAIRWVHDHAKDYGGDPKSIFVMGHSAGRSPGRAGLHRRPLPQGRGAAAVDHQGLRAGRCLGLRHSQAAQGQRLPCRRPTSSWKSSATRTNRTRTCRRPRTSPRARTSRRS